MVRVALDIPTNNPPATDNLLHWLQTGLTPASTATRLNTTTGQLSVFLLENSTSTGPVAPYFGPNPPARIPLSHRYTFVLVDMSGVQAQATDVMRTAAATRRGFNALTVLTQANLEDKVVAGTSYNVTNPGLVNGTVTGTPTPSAGGTGDAASPRPTAGGATLLPGAATVGIIVAAAVFFSL